MCRNLRYRTTASRMSRSVPLLVGGMPGYRRKVNRFGAAFVNVVRKSWSA